MSKKEAVDYWVTSAKEDWEVAQDLFKSGKILKAKLINFLETYEH